jgi:hypothetical protein
MNYYDDMNTIMKDTKLAKICVCRFEFRVNGVGIDRIHYGGWDIEGELEEN